MMKRILLLVLSLNMFAIPAFATAAWRGIPVRSGGVPSSFNHVKPARHAHPLSWEDVTNGFYGAVGAVRDVITDTRVYGPLVPMVHATKEQLVAGAQKIGDIGAQIAGYLATKANDLSESVSGGVQLAMNAATDSGFSSGPKRNAWKSGFAKAREERVQRMRERLVPLPEPVPLPEKQITVAPSPPAEEPVKEPIPVPVSEKKETLIVPEPVAPIAVPLPEPVPLPEKQITVEPSPPAEEPVREPIPVPVPEEKKPLVVPEPMVPIVPITESLPHKKEGVPVPSPEPSQEDTERAVFQEVVEAKPLKERQEVPISPLAETRKKKKKEPVLDKEEEVDAQEYQPIRKKRRPKFKREEDEDLFKLQSEFAWPTTTPSYQPSPLMSAPLQMPVYQQQAPMMMSPQQIPVMGYQSNQNQLNNVAMQMQSSAMAMQMQAANLMAQAQQQPYMQWQQPNPPVSTAPPSTRENTKQEKRTLGMQAIQQAVNAGEGAVQRLLHILDLEFDLLEHLLAGNTGKRVESALRERNNAIKNSNPAVITAYDRLMELSTTYGNEDDIGGRLYHYCVRKSKRAAQSSMISTAKKKFLLHMMCVLERYYEIIEKMQRVANIHY